MDARLLKGGQALHGIVQHRFEMFEVTGDFIKAKVFADALHAPGLGAGFEGPDQQLARVVFVVGTGIVVPQHGQIGMQTRDRLEQHVVMLAGVQGQGDTHRGGQIPGPHAAANHHVAGLDIPGGGANPRGFAPLLQDGVYPGVSEDPRPPAARPLGQGLGDIHGIGIAVRGYMDAAVEIIGLDQRIAFRDLRHRQYIDLQAKDLGHGGAAFEFLETFGGPGNGDGTALAIAGGLTGLGLEAPVQLAGVAGQLRHVDGGAQLAYQTRRVPGGAAGQFLAFQQHHIGDAGIGQVVGHRAANNAAANDNHFTTIGQGCHQLINLALSGSYAGSASTVAGYRASSRPTSNTEPGMACSGGT